MDRLTQPPAILIVEDEPAMLILLKHLLRNLATTYDLITLDDGQRALQTFAGRTVPLLITDYMMPGMNGIQLTAAVKAASSATQVILISAVDSPQIEEQARKGLVDTFLSKTDIFDHLEDVVRSALRPDSARE
jgi:two-component system, response regulator, stage 0 sporulation protein F